MDLMKFMSLIENFEVIIRLNASCYTCRSIVCWIYRFEASKLVVIEFL